MGAPPRNALLGATMKSVRRLFEEFLGVGVAFETPFFCDTEPPSHSIAIRVALQGDFRTYIRLTFEPQLARFIAQKWAGPEARGENASWLEAALEVSNILLGNTTGPLEEQGFRVALLPPRLEVRGATPLPPMGRSVVVPVRTCAGAFTLTFGEVAWTARRPAAGARGTP